MGSSTTFDTSLVTRLLRYRTAVAAIAVLAFGCSAENSASSPGRVMSPPTTDPDTGDAGAAPDAAGSGPSTGIDGSKLCNAARWMGCYPDDPKTASAVECNLAPDGGRYNPSAGYDNAQLACHVQRTSGGEFGAQPVCTPAGTADEGMSCNAPADCAPAQECVGDGTCRHYCCDGQCGDQNDFCDIQPTVESMLNVPVCMPIRRCTLLAPQGASGACPSGETCSVVRENGLTSCVRIGPKVAGESCETDHCGRQLACIGNAGERNCYKLCYTGTRSGECEPGQVCTGGLPLFPIPGFGVCK